MQEEERKKEANKEEEDNENNKERGIVEMEKGQEKREIEISWFLELVWRYAWERACELEKPENGWVLWKDEHMVIVKGFLMEFAWAKTVSFDEFSLSYPDKKWLGSLISKLKAIGVIKMFKPENETKRLLKIADPCNFTISNRSRNPKIINRIVAETLARREKENHAPWWESPPSASLTSVFLDDVLVTDARRSQDQEQTLLVLRQMLGCCERILSILKEKK